MTLLQRIINGVKSEIWTAIEPIDGKKKWFNTGSANKRTAKAKARVYFDGLRQGRFDEVAALVKRKARVLTIGEFLETYEELCVQTSPTDTGVRHNSWIGYRMSLYTIVGQTLDPSFNNNRLRLKAKQRKARNHLVDKQPLTILTASLLRTYIKLMRSRATGTEDLATIKRSTHTRFINAKSLFAPKTYQVFSEEPHFITLPDIKGFTKYQVERGTAARYKAPKDKSLAARTQAAARNLKVTDPEAYKMYVLARNAGLRKSEIVNARVSWLGDHEVNIQSTHSYLTKNGHDRDIPLSPEVYQELLEMTEGLHEDDYIMCGSKTDRNRHAPDRLNKWLAALGWTKGLTGSNKKLHALRANYISHMVKVAGTVVAQHLAGHADYSTTDRHYADPDVKVAREG